MAETDISPQEAQGKRNELMLRIDALEAKIKELKIIYEQYFIDIVPQQPEKFQKEVERDIRNLLHAPFHNSATRFRMRQINARYQTYHTYWTRVLKQREEGRYKRDRFKAKMRKNFDATDKFRETKQGKAETGMKNLFSAYENALRKAGASTDNLDYQAFSKKLRQQAKALKEQHGNKKISYKIAMKNGKPTISASLKD